MHFATADLNVLKSAVRLVKLTRPDEFTYAKRGDWTKITLILTIGLLSSTVVHVVPRTC